MSNVPPPPTDRPAPGFPGGVPQAQPPMPGPTRPALTWVILGLAIVFFLVGLAGGGFQSKLSDVQKNDNSQFLPGSADSTKVANASQQFSSIQSIPAFVVYQNDKGLSDADNARILAATVYFRNAAGGIKGLATDEVGQPQYSRDGKVVTSFAQCNGKCTVAAVSVPLIGKKNGVSAKGPDLVDAEKAVIKYAKDNAGDMTVHSAGAGGLLVAFIDAFDGLDGSLLISAGAVVIIILLFVYRSPVLWFFPLFSAVLALGAASIVIYGLAKSGTITLNGQSQGILSVLVIGAGTDYALLLVSRYREELHEYESRVDAMIAAWKGAAPPILASAVTVILGLICLTFAELNSTAGLGPVCAIGIGATVIVMLTVLPVLLVVSGRWIFWPKRPAVDHQMDVETTHGVWSRVARGIENRKRPSWIGAAVLLIICIAFITGLKTQGLPTEKGFTNKPEAITGQDIYNKAFPQAIGAGAPAQILVNADKADAVIAAAKTVNGIEASTVCIAPDYAKIAAALKSAGAGGATQSQGRAGCAPTALQVTPHGGKTIVNATLRSTYDSSAAYQTVRDLRSSLAKIGGADALVGGESAVNLDIQDASRHDRNLIIPLVLVVILIVLGVVLRALIAPILLIVTVVLSFAASLGVSALFFNHVFHFANSDPAFPLFAFVFLVALGIDYNIFLMTRIREETLEHGTKQGVVRGLTVTGGVIPSAGVVLAATFVVLGVLPIVFLAEIGFTVAFGVLLDTIVVRSILVPALALEIGKKIWWPSKLASSSALD